MPTRQEIEAEKAKLRHLPAAELSAMAGGPSREEIDAEKAKLSKIGPDELLRIAGGRQPEPTMGQRALDTVAAIGETYDKYTGAPTRAAIHRMAQDSQRDTSMVPGPDYLPKPLKVVARGLGAFGEQFGEDPAKAPTGKDIAAQDIGLSTKEGALGVSPAGAAGFVIDLVADPTNFIPIGATAKALTKATVKGAEATGRFAVKGSLKALEKGAELAGATPGVIERTAKNTTKNVVELFDHFAKPKQAEDWGYIKGIAEREGIDPVTLPAEHEFGPSSTIASQEKWLRQTPLREKYIKAFKGKLDEVQGAANNVAKEISGGQTLSPVDAGKLMQESYEGARKTFFDNLATSYDEVGSTKTITGRPMIVELAPEAKATLLGKLKGVEDQFRGVREGATEGQKAQRNQVIKTIEDIREIVNPSPQTVSRGQGDLLGIVTTTPPSPINAQGYSIYQQVIGKMRDIGDLAFADSRNNALVLNPPDIVKYRKIYGDLREAIFDTVKHNLGENVAADLRKANQAQQAFFGETSVIKDIGKPTAAPEKLFQNFVVNGNSRQIDALKSLLPAADFQKLKGAYAQELLQRSYKDGALSFRRAFTKATDKTHDIHRILSPDEAKRFTDVLLLGDRFGPLILNNPKTAEGLGWQKMAQFVKSSVTSEATLEELKKAARNRSLLPYGPPLPPPMTRAPFLPSGSLSDLPLKGARTYSTQQQNSKGGR